MKVLHYSFLTLLCFCVESSISSLIRQPGNFTIAGFLPVHNSASTDPKKCSNQLDFKKVVETAALVYAVTNVNSDPSLLGGVTLGYDVAGTCKKNIDSLLTAINDLFKRHENTNPPVALFLDFPQPLTQFIAYKHKDIPLFSLGPVSSQKRDNVFYLEPGQPRLPNALLKLIEQFKWTVLDVFVENRAQYELFKDLISSAKICESNVFYAKPNNSATDILNSNETKLPLLVFSDTFQILEKIPSFYREIVFVGDFLDIGKNQSVDIPKIIALQRKRAKLNGFKEFLSESAKNNETWLGGLLRNSSQFLDCSGSSKECMSGILDSLLGELWEGGKVVDAVYVVANALAKTQSGTLSVEDVSKVSEFTSPTGNTVRFTTDNDLLNVDYEVYNLAKTPAVIVGHIKTFPEKSNTVAELSLDALKWTNNEPEYLNSSCLTTCPKGLTPVPSKGRLSKCCVTCRAENATECGKGRRLGKDGTQCVRIRLDYLRWRHPLSIFIMILVAIMFCVLVSFVNLYVKKADTPTISTSKLATMPLLLSLFITLILPLLPILKPSPTACNAYTFGFVHGLGIPLCILISRAYSHYKRFRTEEGALKKKVCHGDPQNLIAVVLIFIQLILSIIFLVVSPAHVIYSETAEPDVDYIECSMFSQGEFLYPFFYTILLTIVFSVKNFGAVTQEDDIYESHFAALSIFGYYFLSLSTMIVVYGVQGKVKIMLLCVIAFLYFFNYLIFIFFPKIYVIVFKRDPSKFSPFPLPMSDVEFLIVVDQDDPPLT